MRRLKSFVKHDVVILPYKTLGRCQHFSDISSISVMEYSSAVLVTGLEIDNEKVENKSIFDTSKKSSECLHSITKIKSREYRSIDNVKSILFSD